jgi:hypothetical protein
MAVRVKLSHLQNGKFSREHSLSLAELVFYLLHFGVKAVVLCCRTELMHVQALLFYSDSTIVVSGLLKLQVKPISTGYFPPCIILMDKLAQSVK